MGFLSLPLTGPGTITGPLTSQDKSIVLFDGVTGQVVQQLSNGSALQVLRMKSDGTTPEWASDVAAVVTVDQGLSGIGSIADPLENTLVIGLAGGQTIIGSTLTSESLNIKSNAADVTTGSVNFLDTLEASSATVGAVTIAGGLAVAKRVFALDMTVTNDITGSITGNAGTVTTNADLTGPVTSTGNATAIASGAIKANMLQDAAFDLGAADVTINLSNSNGSYVTNLSTNGSLTIGAGFGCNTKTAQAAYTVGGPLASYVTGAFGLDSDANMQALFDMVVSIRAALLANGILTITM